MNLWPAIDLLDGSCVRLSKGDYNSKIIYADDPVSMAREFESRGAKCLHVVDLSRAKDPSQKQIEVIAALCQQTSLRIQVGGGIRSLTDCAELIALGVDRVVVGSLSVRDPKLTQTILSEFPRTVLALDGRMGMGGKFYLTTMAWQETESVTIDDVLGRYPQVQAVLCTDVNLDGCMMGPNLQLYRQLIERYPNLEILASGGVKECGDLTELLKVGVGGVIVGKALYEGAMTIEEGLACSLVV